MVGVQTKRFNWIRSPSAWEQSQSWREKRALMREQFANSSAAANAGFAKAWNTQGSGMAELAIKQAAARQQAAQAAAREKAFEEAFAGLDLSI